MTDRDLTDLLERLGERVDVSPPPLAAMTRAADRNRRRRTAWVVGSAAAAVAVVAAGTQVVGEGLTDGRDSRPPATRPIPDGMQLVGIGRAAIAVPDDWGRNQIKCGTPIANTAVVGVQVINYCFRSRSAGVDAVWLHEDDAFGRGEEIEIDGTPATRTPVTCTSGEDQSTVMTCSASVYVPSEDVRFEASSSTSRERVDELLDEVRILDDQVGVPSFDPLAGRVSAENYVERLRKVGLTMVKRWGPERGSGDRILDVQPAPGTVVKPGAEVTVSVPRPPTDDMVLGLAAYRPNGSPSGSLLTELTDAQIRSGATVRLRVGDRISFHAQGQAIYGADVVGTSLDVEYVPADSGYPRHATAARTGTTTFTLTATSGGEEVEVGSITVVVRR